VCAAASCSRSSRSPSHGKSTIEASLRLIDDLEREITDCERELRQLGVDHRYVPLLCTVQGIGWVLAYTIAAELGDINRFPTPRKLAGYSGLCPRRATGVPATGSARRLVDVCVFGAESAFGELECEQAGERGCDGDCGDQTDRADEGCDDRAGDDLAVDRASE
jgi:hypothetical protein